MPADEARSCDDRLGVLNLGEILRDDVVWPAAAGDIELGVAADVHEDEKFKGLTKGDAAAQPGCLLEIDLWKTLVVNVDLLEDCQLRSVEGKLTKVGLVIEEFGDVALERCGQILGISQDSRKDEIPR